MAKKKIIPFNRANNDIYETFAMDLQDYINGGEMPEKAGTDLRYVLMLQKKRLESLNIEQECRITSLKEEDGYRGNTVKKWSDNRYCGEQHVIPCRIVRKMQKNGRRMYRSSNSASMYVSQLNAKDISRTENDAFSCPVCGAVSTVRQLEEGCPYCGTFFKNAELFPNVNNYLIMTRSGLEKFHFREFMVCWPLGMVLMALVVEMFSSRGGEMTQFEMLFFIILGGFLMAWVLMLLYKLGRSLAFFAVWFGSGRRFEKQMQRYDDNSSYDYFTEKAAKQMEMVIFSEDPSKLPIYEGADIKGKLKDILNFNCLGPAALRHFRVDGTMCTVVAELYADITRERKRKLSCEREIIRLELIRDLSKDVDLSASPLKVQCKNCGGSFNAVQSNTCPYCRGRYENDYSDWTIRDIRFKKQGLLSSIIGAFGCCLLIGIVPLSLMILCCLWPVAMIAFFILKMKKDSTRH